MFVHKPLVYIPQLFQKLPTGHNNDLVSENKFKITVEEKEKFENEVD